MKKSNIILSTFAILTVIVLAILGFTGYFSSVEPPDYSASSFTAEIWADNWFALYVNGELVGEDSVPITTERSFNKEVITFDAEYPLTIAIIAKDFKETNSGIEYIGEDNQQMGDGGIIAQITDQNGDMVVVTDGTWSIFITHFAPTDKACEKSVDPDTECDWTITDTPDGWFNIGFDDSLWGTAVEYSVSEVGAKDGYDEVIWHSGASLVWGEDLEQVNTILLRTTVVGL